MSSRMYIVIQMFPGRFEEKKKGAKRLPLSFLVANGRMEEHPIVQADEGQEHVRAEYVHIRFFRQFHIAEDEKQNCLQREHNGQRYQFFSTGEGQQRDDTA